MYDIQIELKAKKFLQNIQNPVKSKIVSKIQSLSENPRPHLCKKLKKSVYYRIRVSDYRIIYKIEDDILKVIVITIGHRKDIYNRI